MLPSLPLFLSPPPPLEGHNESAAMSDDPLASSPSPRLLVVEDEESLREVTVEVLLRAGFDPVPAEDGARALELFSQEPDRFSLVILDLSMPVMDGAECFRHMRAIREDVKVLLTSGYASPETGTGLDAALLAGCLQKPYRIGELLGAVKGILGRPS
jgi:DNA-binding response OmpR family regulator